MKIIEPEIKLNPALANREWERGRWQRRKAAEEKAALRKARAEAKRDK